MKLYLITLWTYLVIRLSKIFFQEDEVNDEVVNLNNKN